MFSKLAVEFQETLKSLREHGSFRRNILINSAGTSSAYLLGFVLSPIIARIYPPEAYGLYALFNAFAASLTLMASLDYVNALLLPRTFKDFKSLFQLALILIVTTLFLSIASIYFFKTEILAFFSAEALTGLITLVPVMVLLSAVNRTLELWNIRTKEFKQGAKAKVVGIVGAKLVTIAHGALNAGNPLGFILGDLISKPITTVSLLSKSIKNEWRGLLNFSFKGIIAAAKEYRNYPLYNLPANTLIGLGGQLPVYLLALDFNSAVVGHFSLAVSLINAPTQLLGVAIAQVFFQRASETYHSNLNELRSFTRKFFKRLIYIAVVPFSLIVVYGDVLFAFVFGENWQLAGVFAGYLSVMAYATFISTSISSLLRVFRLEKLQFYIVLSGAFLLTIGMFISLKFETYYALVIAYSCISFLLQFTLVAITLKKTQVRALGLLAESIIALFLMVAFMYSLRMIWPLIF
ncbi:MAG: polysaccharide biosynthesis protein [Cyclobacteriaceae bacterium]|nr:MAG: polysaccharide biosynthesis protein [Cyclobacteriaceae bacterium]